MRSLMLFPPSVKHINKHVIHGELNFSTLILLPLINTSHFTALLTTDFPLLHSTICTQWSSSSPPFLPLSPLPQMALPSKTWNQLPLPRALCCLLSLRFTPTIWAYTQGKESSFSTIALTLPLEIPWLWPGWPPLLDAPPPVPAFFPDMLTCLSPGDRYHAGPLCSHSSVNGTSSHSSRPLCSTPPHFFPPPTPLLPCNGPAPPFWLSMWWRWFITSTLSSHIPCAARQTHISRRLLVTIPTFIGNLTLGSCDMDTSKIPSLLSPLSAYLSTCKAKHTTSQDIAFSIGPLLSLRVPTLTEHLLTPSSPLREFSPSLPPALSVSTMRIPNSSSLLLTMIQSKISRTR